MQKATLKNPVIEEIGYLSDGFTQCGTWGVTPPTQVKFTNEVTTNGVKISLDSNSILSPLPRMIAFRYGSYYALVNPIQFSNIIIGPRIKVALLSNSGNLIAAYNNPDLNFIKRYLFNKNKVESKKDMISINIMERFTAVATEHKSNFYATLSNQQLALLPLGLLLALPIIAVIIYFSKRRLSVIPPKNN